MKKYTAVLFLSSLCLTVLAGCGSVPETSDPSAPALTGTADTEGRHSPEPADDDSFVESDADKTSGSPKDTQNNAGGPEVSPEEAVTWRLRIADGAESGFLTLAGEKAGELLTLSTGRGIPVYLDGQEADASVLEDGMTVDIVFDGMILETYPEQFGQVYSIQAYSRGSEANPGGSYYDLCGLYLQVLNDLWDADPGLNENIEWISVDLSQAPGELSEGEKQAVAWIFAGQHGLGMNFLTFTYEELAENGFLTAYEGIYQWENGILFTITADTWEDGEIYSLPALKFDAEKWRSPRGAYFFCDCLALWPEMGTWSDYEVGREAIS